MSSIIKIFLQKQMKPIQDIFVPCFLCLLEIELSLINLFDCVIKLEMQIPHFAVYLSDIDSKLVNLCIGDTDEDHFPLFLFLKTRIYFL